MADFFDNFLARFIIVFLLLAWLNLYIDNLFLLLGIGAIAFLLLSLVGKLFKRKGKEKGMGIKELETVLAIMGGEKFSELYYKTLPQVDSINRDKNTIFIEGEKSELLFFNYKFSAMTKDEIARAYNLAEKLGAKYLTIFTKRPQRDILILTNALNVEIKFPTTRKLLAYLKEHNAVPKNPTVKPKGNRLPIKEILLALISPKNRKYYLFSGIILGIMSFFTPFQLYYLIMASIPLILCTLTFIRNEA